VDILMTTITALGLLLVARNAFWSGPDSRTWEERWHRLGPADRTRIATATRPRGSAIKLSEVEEVDLAKGFRRREARRCAYIELPALILLTTVGALWIADLLSSSEFYWTFWPLVIAYLVWQRLRERHLNGKIRQVSPDSGF
jgi:hypothetical protein